MSYLSSTPRLQQTVDRVSYALRRALTFWRRSVQARVVASTVLLSALVVSIVGWLLIQQTREGLLENRVDQVVAEAESETAQVRAQLAATVGTDVDEAGQQEDVVGPLSTRGAARGFAVILSPAIGSGNRLEDGGAKFTQGLDIASVPESLQQHFEEPAATAWTYTGITTTRAIAGLPQGPGVVVGTQVTLPADDHTYTLYYLYSLDEERQTLALVTRALLTAGVLLLLLVAGLAWLVARQVVTPIRMARRVAERLAAGQLQERLRVTGEDDLARLATSFNQMASNLQRQIRQLEELSRLQRRFVSDVSHELRTPLTTVRMAGDVLHDARVSFDPVTARAAELLQLELDRFETLLADLLEISRFDAGAAVLEAEDVDLVDVARRVVDMTRALAEQRHTRVVVDAADGPCLAEADPRRVERIVRNLVTNAIDHAEGRDIRLLVAGDDHSAAIAVRDHGVGLAPGESAMVFNRFWRADPARARTSGGTGLGLSISLEDTHLHGGWLQAWGRPGEGAQFRLTLPRRLSQPLRHSPLPLVPHDALESA
ncbi:MtrAB system histidine kinase MtrB [Nocardioides sp. Soil805]|uniref:MtrAB system histidine kinase MtrB n=1 Tax=Nocardioides sp. Soil805 TaxID=1736416 RepID=UPI0007027BF0|nr:MtrAB system histidine kinase MtrB [Nocardioides sp. Soil805]KRF30225.1 histidine kinase [Nocardioides sp. Soil805]